MVRDFILAARQAEVTHGFAAQWSQEPDEVPEREPGVAVGGRSPRGLDREETGGSGAQNSGSWVLLC